MSVGTRNSLSGLKNRNEIVQGDAQYVVLSEHCSSSRNHNNHTKCCAVLSVRDWTRATVKWSREQTPFLLTSNLSFVVERCCRPSARWWWSHTVVHKFLSMWEFAAQLSDTAFSQNLPGCGGGWGWGCGCGGVHWRSSDIMRWWWLTVLVCIRSMALFALLGVSVPEHCGTWQQVVMCQFCFQPCSSSSRHTSVCPTCCCVSASGSPAGVSL